uniref:TTF-type domain-containing protein n=1 Tax=Astyanax mexicanus TaxID=7994 RepID=A0A3B1J4P0_ASTMX
MAKRKISDFFTQSNVISLSNLKIPAQSQPSSVCTRGLLENAHEHENADEDEQPSTSSKSTTTDRHFRTSWLQEFAWLRYDSIKKTMYCEFCSKASRDIAGNTDFVTGTNHFKKETVKKHGDSRKHKNARDWFIAKRAPTETPLARAVTRACDKTAEKEIKELKMKFNTAYMIAREELPFTKFTSQVLLMRKNGLDVSKTYDNNTACAEFIGCIADDVKAQTVKEAQKAKYISVITDCGTDVSGRDNVIAYCRHVSGGLPMNRLVGLAELQHGHAKGIFSTIKSLFNDSDQTNPNWWQNKVSAFGADGASVNMGATGGIGALFRSEIGKHILSFHCLPHRLELAMLNTQKSLPMIEKVYDLLQLVWKTYHFSPKSKRELKAIGVELGCTIRTPSAVKTQRWLPHIFRQMESLLFVGFCHFLHDLFGEISKLSLTLQKNSLILPQAVAAVNSCIVTVKGMKDRPLRNGKLQEFLQNASLDSVAQNVLQQDNTQTPDRQIDTLLKWYQEILMKNGCVINAVQTEWRMLKILIKGQFMDKSYSGLWEVMLSKEPYCSDFQNIFHLAEIMLVLPISAAQCERGFSAQNRIKSKVRNSLNVSTVEDLVRISSEGPSLEQFDPEPCVKSWLTAITHMDTRKRKSSLKHVVRQRY